MIPQFDIFHIVETFEPRWVGTAATLEEARSLVQELGSKQPGEYLIMNQRTGHKEIIKVAASE